MRFVLVTVILALGLFFGCTQVQPEAASPQSPPSVAPVSLSGLGFSQLKALGTPAECTITPKGAAAPYTLSIQGEKVRKEGTFQAGPSKEIHMVTIISGDSGYIYVKDFGYTGRCLWAKFKSSSACMSMKDMDSALASEFTCKPASFGNEKFVPSGETCDMANAMSDTDVNLVAGYFPCMVKGFDY